jgi:hypothetical protein
MIAMRMIDADALMKDMQTCCSATQFGRMTAKMCIKRAPTVSAEAVIHCGECKYYRNYDNGTHPAGGDCAWNGILVDDDDFCSYGERKDGEK